MGLGVEKLTFQLVITTSRAKTVDTLKNNVMVRNTVYCVYIYISYFPFLNVKIKIHKGPWKVDLDVRCTIEPDISDISSMVYFSKCPFVRVQSS